MCPMCLCVKKEITLLFISCSLCMSAVFREKTASILRGSSFYQNGGEVFNLTDVYLKFYQELNEFYQELNEFYRAFSKF